MPEVVNGKASTSTPAPADDAELYAGEAEPNAAELAAEAAQARRLAERYRLNFLVTTERLDLPVAYSSGPLLVYRLR